MKIRSGFVSNSSSSSFVVSAGSACPNVFFLGTKMLEIRNDEWEIKDDNVAYKEIDKLREANSLGINPDTPIAFVTTNYDTFIRKVDDKFYVNTCNNQDWSRLNYSAIDTYYFDEEELPQDPNTYHWWVKEGVIGRQITKKEWKEFTQAKDIKPRYADWPECWKSTNHFSSIVMTPDKEIICVDCFFEEKKPDMLIQPARRVKLIRPSYIIRKPRIQFRG